MGLPALLPAVASAGSFVVVLALAYAIRLLMNPERTARDRVAELTGMAREADPLFIQHGEPEGLAGKVGQLARPKGEEERELRLQLVQAGLRGRNALEVFSAVRVVLALGLLGLGVLLTLRFREPVIVASAGFAGFAVGYLAPKVWLGGRVRRRQKELMRAFPDALDLLVSSVEAGLGLDAALRRVAQEMEGPAPVLAHELQLVNHEVAAGVPRLEALRHLDQRTGVQEFNSLVNVLVQAERFGTSVAKALRVHSELVRRKRMLRAEEKAAKISPKLTVVMIVFIFPVLFAVLVGPAAVQFVRTLLPVLWGE